MLLRSVFVENLPVESLNTERWDQEKVFSDKVKALGHKALDTPQM